MDKEQLLDCVGIIKNIKEIWKIISYNFSKIARYVFYSGLSLSWSQVNVKRENVYIP